MDYIRMEPQYDPSHAEAIECLFDVSYYLATNPDVRAQGLDPLIHFLTAGWREGRNPSADFDVNYYLRVNSDVAAIELNPLVHYAWCGASENRQPRRPLDTIRCHIENATSPRVRAADWGGAVDRSRSLAYADLARSLAASFSAAAGVVISVSHDDYEDSLGGVQNVIRHERAGFEQMGQTYLHLSPAAPLPMLADPTQAQDFRFRIRLDDRFLGTATAEILTRCLAEFAGAGGMLRLVIHHCLGHDPERLQDIAQLCREQPIFWVHDFFALCTSHDLLRNNVQYCGAPPLGSPACMVCNHGGERGDHLRRIRGFISALNPIILAPSQAALDVWLAQDVEGWDIRVQPLARLVFSDDEPRQQAAADEPLRIAHVGMRRLSKGWPVFEELARRFSRNSAYAFFQFGIDYGAQGPGPGCIRHVDVRVSRDNPDRMIEALAEHRIDVVVNWSLWPETFCFAGYEALAAGAFLLARADAGNVPCIVDLAPEQARVVRDQAALFNLFESEDVRDLVKGAPIRRGVLIPEHGAAAWLHRTGRGTVYPTPAHPQRLVSADV